MKKRLLVISIVVVILSLLITGTAFAVVGMLNTAHLTATGIITVNTLPSGGSSGGSGSSGGAPINIGYISVGDSGEVYEDVVATSTDMVADVVIDTGTIAKDKNGNALHSIRIEPAINVPALPQGENVVGIPYEFLPNGATFDPAIDITLKYDPADVPSGTDLKLVFWNGFEWVELTDVVINPVTGTVTGKTTHFTKFALITVPKPIVTPTVTPTIPAEPTVIPTVEPTVVPPTVEPTKPAETTIEPTVEPTQTAIDTTTVSPTHTTPIIEPKSKSNTYWAVLVLIGAIVVICAVVLIIRRKKK